MQRWIKKVAVVNEVDLTVRVSDIVYKNKSKFVAAVMQVSQNIKLKTLVTVDRSLRCHGMTCAKAKPDATPPMNSRTP